MSLYLQDVFRVSLLSIVFIISSCGKKGSSNTNDSTNESTNTTVLPQVILPNEDTLTLYKKNGSENTFYKSTNLGGLGVETTEDKLDLYSGIPVQVNSNYDTNVTIDIIDKSDQECKNIFSYSKYSPQININLPNFIKPLTCNLSINLNAKSIKTGVVENPSISKIKVRFNLTMKAYMYSNDKNYLKFSGQQYPDDSKFREIVSQIKSTRKVSITNLSLDNFNFLEGAKDYIQTFEISNSSIGDYNLFKEFKILKDVSLNKLNINDSSAKKILGMLPKLDRLSIRDNLLTSLRTIIDTKPDLISLDVSANPIQNLSEIKALAKLNTVILRNMNLTTLLPLNNVTQIKDLDISENPLRRFTDVDTGYLSSLINLEALNVSVDRDNPNSTPITDKVLSDYFRSFVLDSKTQKLKKFIARNKWEKKYKDCNMINDFERNIGSIDYLENIEYLDLHGNGCVDSLGFYSGLTSLPFMNYRKIKYLNISDAPVRDFNRVIDWRDNNITFVFNETPWNYDAGVFMTKESCLSTFPTGNKNRLQCEGLDPNFKKN
ncbi:hypothetical protein GCL60_09775 [Silvanigrella paludirubra]|uniref:Leucine-rich repeat domain-containing protein n=1 Tax=Silvanigrella paludirubra TaxID=2499159 RepID=A0A6N6VV89_9BACT|nr:hypothetical protein [Silvanigrella paludirubra]KAB8039134.1 hypothetical protein GCL60_09775 [Silvanigrella paludirubra]